ncbi:MAG: DNA polymerase III subunit epsilon [Pseudomonadota bacterium]
MREIVLDTETTGLDPREDRIVEIGAVELMNHLRTGREYHIYINPGRSMPTEAFRIHGLGDAFLADKPRFDQIVDDFMAFIGEAKLVIHNASFDMGMINAELLRLGRDRLPDTRALDTVAVARKRFPGAQVSLDALCKRFGVDNSGRTKHGALLDSELLADVYLELCGGRQQGFALDATASMRREGVRAVGRTGSHREREHPLPSRLTEAEIAAHDAFIESLSDSPLWRKASAN